MHSNSWKPRWENSKQESRLYRMLDEYRRDRSNRRRPCDLRPLSTAMLTRWWNFSGESQRQIVGISATM